MLSDEDKARIQAEEEYRQKIRGRLESDNVLPSAPAIAQKPPHAPRDKRGAWVVLAALCLILVYLYSRPVFEPKRTYTVLLDVPAPVGGKPGDYVTIKSQSWSKDGFNNVATMKLQIFNGHEFAVKDIRLACKFYGPSGTRLSDNRHTLFETVPSKHARWFTDVNVGAIDNQSEGGRCEVEGADRF